MTAGVAVVEGGDVWVGYDSCSVAGGGMTIDNAAKLPAVFRIGDHDLVIVVAGLDSIAGEVHGHWQPPDPEHISDSLPFLRSVAASLRDHFMAEPVWTLTREKDEGNLEGHFIAAWRGVAVEIAGDFGVCRPRSGEVAIGSGRDFLLGALYATTGQPAQDRVHVALQAAAYYQQDVAAPFTIIRAAG